MKKKFAVGDFVYVPLSDTTLTISSFGNYVDGTKFARCVYDHEGVVRNVEVSLEILITFSEYEDKKKMFEPNWSEEGGVL